MKPPHAKKTNAFAQSPIQAPIDRSMFGRPLLNGLTGGPLLNVQASVPPRPDMLRSDGSLKGQGYLGPVRNNRGQTMTEYSIGVEIDGKETDIPTMVPTLTPEEIQYLTNIQDGMPIPQGIKQKAVDHALMRMRQGLSPFHDSGPSHTKPKGY